MSEVGRGISGKKKRETWNGEVVLRTSPCSNRYQPRHPCGGSLPINWPPGGPMVLP